MTSTNLAGGEVETATSRTKKAARAQGYLNHDEWLRQHKAPRRDACPTVVKNEEFFRGENCEELFGPYAFRHQGLGPSPEAEPATYKHPQRRPASACPPPSFSMSVGRAGAARRTRVPQYPLFQASKTASFDLIFMPPLDLRSG